jgi:hypothetical protein
VTKTEMARLVKTADAAGKAAAAAVTPVPMVVQERANPLDDSSPVVRQWAPVMDGVCGFAWVNVKPGNSAFANWLKKQPGSRWRTDSYEGGVSMSVFDYNQSLTRKAAYAGAFARVLSEAGIRAYSASRMD